MGKKLLTVCVVLCHGSGMDQCGSAGSAAADPKTKAASASIAGQRCMKLIDKKSLLRQITVRQKWHKDLTVEEVIDIIRDAPEIEEKKNDLDHLDYCIIDLG